MPSIKIYPLSMTFSKPVRILRWATGVILPCNILVTGLFMSQGWTEEPLLPLKVAVSLAFQNNPSMNRILSQYQAQEARYKLTRGIYDWTAGLGFDYSDTDQARTVIFQPSNIKQRNFNASVFKAFPTGTELSFMGSILRSNDDSSFNVFNTRYQTELGISLQQSLLHDFIGLPQKVRLETDKIKLNALKKSLWREMETLATTIARQYWELWRNQQLWEVALESKKRSGRFFQRNKAPFKIGLTRKR